jgi:general secretion pathway protein G
MMKSRVKQAFTMFEMLMVIALIGVIMAFIFPRMQQWLGKTGKADITLKFAAIKEGLGLYKMEFGVFPSTKDGLQALLKNPHPNLEQFKRNEDKWPFIPNEDMIHDKAGNDFIYNCPPVRFKDRFHHYELMYLGPTQSEEDKERVIDGN